MSPRPFIALVALACNPVQPDASLPVFGGPPEPPVEETPYGGPSRPAEDGDGQCGAVHYVEMSLTGTVADAGWEPAAEVEVWLEERTWTPGTEHGAGMTDANGRFAMPLTDVPIVEGCWGIGPQFFVVATDGVHTCEVPANLQLVIAWLDGTHEADISGYPCVLPDE